MKIMRGLSILFVVVLLAGCMPVSAPAGTPAAAPKIQGEFAFIHNNKSHPVLAVMNQGFLDACADYGLPCHIYAAEGGDVAAMVAEAERALTTQPITGAVFGIYDETLDGSINAWGGPWVNIHFALTPDVGQARFKHLIAWAATDMADYARRAGSLMCEKLRGQSGSVAITQSVFSADESRVAAEFTQAFRATCPDIPVLAPQEEGLDLPAAIAKAGAILTANPDLIGAFSTTGNGPSTWAGAAKDAGKQPGDLTIISMDYTKPNLDLVRDGWVYALVGQPLYEETYRAVELLLANYRQEPFAYANMIPAPLILRDNLETYYGYAERVKGQVP